MINAIYKILRGCEDFVISGGTTHALKFGDGPLVVTASFLVFECPVYCVR